MQLQRSEGVRLAGNGLFDDARVLVEDLLAPGNDLRKNRKAVARRRPRKDRTISPLFHLAGKIASFGNRQRGWFAPVLLIRWCGHMSASGGFEIRQPR